jgi:hypothetical protein
MLVEWRVCVLFSHADNRPRFDENFFATATREELIAAIKEKDQKVAAGKSTISTLIEQITDYQSVSVAAFSMDLNDWCCV